MPELDSAFETVCFDWLIVPHRDKLLVTELAVTRLKEMKMKFQKMTHPTGEKGILLNAKVG